MLIAVPCEAPGGLEAEISEHFGHCHAFTLVAVDDGGKVEQVTILENEDHDECACTAPVMLLKEKGVDALVAGGVGAGPLAGLQQAGITVFGKEAAGSVAEAVALVTRGEAPELGERHTCGGGGGGGGCCGGHGHHHQEPVVREPIEGKADVQKDRVVTIHYTLKDADGTQLDSSVGGEPLAYLHGRGMLVAGLERQLDGLEAGDEKTVAVNADEAYGERDDSKITEVPLEEMPPNPEVGAVLYAREQDGSTIALTVVEVGETHATLDLNHPLAGRDLVFEITVVKVEKATEEELAHGHAH